jgi:hypothetical protein
MVKGRGWFWALWLCLLAGFGFYEWLLFARWGSLSSWGSLGSALGPVAAVFSAGAVFAALRSIELQRDALAGQQEELNKQQEQIERHMSLLEDQREQFARSADAQERLVKAQDELAAATKALAAAQANANREAAALRLAQHSQTIATLMAAATQAKMQMSTIKADNSAMAQVIQPEFEGLIQRLDARLTLEGRGETQLRDLIEKGFQ